MIALDPANPTLVVRACPGCGRRNRLPPARLCDPARCGACRAALPPQADPIEVGEPLFDAIVGAARLPVLVDFWAPWCGSSRMTAPEVHKAARSLCGRALVLKVNAQEQRALAARFAVRLLPHFAVFRAGRLVQVQPGLVGHGHLEKLALGMLH